MQLHSNVEVLLLRTLREQCPLYMHRLLRARQVLEFTLYGNLADRLPQPFVGLLALQLLFFERVGYGLRQPSFRWRCRVLGTGCGTGMPDSSPNLIHAIRFSVFAAKSLWAIHRPYLSALPA